MIDLQAAMSELMKQERANDGLADANIGSQSIPAAHFPRESL